MKLMNSGFPPHVQTDEEKKKFCDEVYNELGIDMDPDEVVFKKSMRLCSKLLCNTLWGEKTQ